MHEYMAGWMLYKNVGSILEPNTEVVKGHREKDSIVVHKRMRIIERMKDYIRLHHRPRLAVA